MCGEGGGGGRTKKQTGGETARQKLSNDILNNKIVPIQSKIERYLERSLCEPNLLVISIQNKIKNYPTISRVKMCSVR